MTPWEQLILCSVWIGRPRHYHAQRLLETVSVRCRMLPSITDNHGDCQDKDPAPGITRIYRRNHSHWCRPIQSMDATRVKGLFTGRLHFVQDLDTSHLFVLKECGARQAEMLAEIIACEPYIMKNGDDDLLLAIPLNNPPKGEFPQIEYNYVWFRK